MEIIFSIIIGAIIILATTAIVIMIARRSVKRTPQLIIILLVLLSAGAAAIFVLTPQFGRRIQTALSTNVAETSVEPEFPELKTRFYNAPREQAFEAAASVIENLPDWKLVAQNASEGRIEAEKKVVIFTDDVSISLGGEPEQTRVDVRSKSREGKGDFGENRRHIAQFLSALDKRLSRADAK